MEELSRASESFFKFDSNFVLVVYAIIQVWLIAAWKRYVQKGKIAFYETGLMEIGYGLYGPAIGTESATIQARFSPISSKTIDTGKSLSKTWLTILGTKSIIKRR